MTIVKARRRHLENRLFHNVSLVVMLFIAFLCVMPFVLMFSASITSETALISENPENPLKARAPEIDRLA